MTPPLLLINMQESIKKKLSPTELVTLVLQQHPLIKQGIEILKTTWGPKFTCKYLPATGQEAPAQGPDAAGGWP